MCYDDMNSCQQQILNASDSFEILKGQLTNNITKCERSLNKTSDQLIEMTKLVKQLNESTIIVESNFTACDKKLMGLRNSTKQTEELLFACNENHNMSIEQNQLLLLNTTICQQQIINASNSFEVVKGQLTNNITICERNLNETRIKHQDMVQTAKQLNESIPIDLSANLTYCKQEFESCSSYSKTVNKTLKICQDNLATSNAIKDMQTEKYLDLASVLSDKLVKLALCNETLQHFKIKRNLDW